MYKKLLIAVAAAASFSAAAFAQSTGTAAGDIPGVMPATSAFLPSGTTMKLTLDDNLSTANHEGEGVNLTVSENVMARDGSIAIPAGTMLQGRLTGVHNAQSSGDANVVRVNFDDLVLKGQHYPFSGGVIAVQVTNPMSGTQTGNVVSDQDAAKLVAEGKLGAGVGTVLAMGKPMPGGDGTIAKGSVFTVRSTSGIAVK